MNVKWNPQAGDWDRDRRKRETERETERERTRQMRMDSVSEWERKEADQTTAKANDRQMV